ncbi:putative Efflux ABC transporter, permease/ATP-binding protein [Streptomyces misionensis JCM 4497]
MAVLYDHHGRPGAGRRGGDRYRRPPAGVDTGAAPARHARAGAAGDGAPARRPARAARAPRPGRRARPARRRGGRVRSGCGLPDRLAGARGGLRPGPDGPRGAPDPGLRAGRRGAAGAGRRRPLVPHAARPGRPAHLAVRAPVPHRSGRRHPPGARRDPGGWRRWLRGRPAGQDRARGTARGTGALRAGAVRPLLRLGRRDAALPDPARRLHRADRRPGPRPPAGAARPRRRHLDAGPRRPHLPRLPRLPRRRGRPGQPELEGLPGRDLLRRRHPAERGGDGGGRPGVRVRRAAPHRVGGAHGVVRRNVRGAAGAVGRRSARPLPAGLLAAGPCLPGAGPGRRGPPDRRAGLGRGTPAVDRPAGQGVRRGGGPPSAGTRLLLRLGGAHAGRGPARLPSAVVPPRLGLAARQRPDRSRSGPLRPARRGPGHRPRPGRRRHGRRPPAPRGAGGLPPLHASRTGPLPARLYPRVTLGGRAPGAADGGGGCLSRIGGPGRERPGAARTGRLSRPTCPVPRRRSRPRSRTGPSASRPAAPPGCCRRSGRAGRPRRRATPGRGPVRRGRPAVPPGTT